MIIINSNIVDRRQALLKKKATQILIKETCISFKIAFDELQMRM